MIKYEDMEKNVLYIDKREENNSRGTRFKDHILKNYKNSILKVSSDTSLTLDNIEFKTLEYGDYAYNNCLFEYKTIRDYRESVDSTKMFMQLEDMRNSEFKYPNLMIVGKFEDYGYDNKQFYTTYASIVRFLQTLPVFTVPNEYIAFRSMLKTFAIYNDGIGVPKRYYDNNYNPAMNMLYSLNSVGGKTAKAITTSFNVTSLSDLFKLTPNNLKEISGIRDKSANKIYNEIFNFTPEDTEEEKKIKINLMIKNLEKQLSKK